MWSGVQACAGRTVRTGRQPQRAVALAKVNTVLLQSPPASNTRSQSKGRRLGTPALVVYPLLQQKPWQQPMGKPPSHCTRSCSKARCNIPLRALTCHAAPSACKTANLRPYTGCELPVLVLALSTEPTDPTASSGRKTLPPLLSSVQHLTLCPPCCQLALKLLTPSHAPLSTFHVANAASPLLFIWLPLYSSPRPQALFLAASDQDAAPVPFAYLSVLPHPNASLAS